MQHRAEGWTTSADGAAQAGQLLERSWLRAVRALRYVAAVVVLGGVFLAPADAEACSVPYSEPGARVSAADLAVYGEVVSVRMLEEEKSQSPDEPPEMMPRYEAQIRVLQVFKGKPDQTVVVRGHTNGGLCGLRLREGQRVGLLLDRPGPPYEVGTGSTISLAELREAAAAGKPCAKPRMSAKERLRAARFAIYGEVVSLRRRLTDTDEFYEAKVRIRQVFKGKAGPAVRVHAPVERADCQLGLQRGKRIGLLLGGTRRPYRVGARNGISLTQLRKATGGRWHRPGHS